MGTLFVTGASGFVGRRLLASIPAGRYERVVALSRTAQPPLAGVTWVAGDLRDPAPWQRFLFGGADVAHLAASTGGASADTHRAVNAEGTDALVRACAREGAGGLLFVSTIAARYPDDAWYPYATSKREAEAIVRAGTVPFTIVRPTIVLGPGSPILARLRSLAGGPAVAVIGDGRARVQPVAVDDLVGALALLLERRAFDGVIHEFGGPEILSMEQLLVRIRAASGRPPARVVHLPYGPARGGLMALEAVLGARAPVTAGQLTAFVQDSTAEPGGLWRERRDGLTPVDRMVAVDA